MTTRNRALLFVAWVATVLLAVWLGTLGDSKPSEQLVGYGGTSIFGCENTGKRSKGCEFQVDPVTLASGASATIWTMPAPTPVTGEQLQILATLNLGSLDACSGAACNGWTQRRLICTWTTGACLDNTLDASDFQVSTAPPANMVNVSAAISTGSSPATIIVTATCTSSYPCDLGGTLSVNRILPHTPATPVDSGAPDASDSGPIDSGTDAADAADSGTDAGPPTILAVLPPYGAGGGGEPFTVVLGAPLPATVSGVTIGGQAATSCSYSAPNVACLTPAYTGAPASTGQNFLTVTVNSSNGPVSSPATGPGSNLLNFVYLSTTGLKEWHTALVDAGPSIIPSRAVSGDNWVQASGSAQPATLPAFNGQTIPYAAQAALAFNVDGGAEYMSMSFGTAVTPNAGGTMILVLRVPNEEAATNIGFVIGGSGTTDLLMNWSTFGSLTWDVGNTLASVQNNTKNVDVNAHILAGTVNGASSIMYVDGTGSGTGTLTQTGNLSATNMLGAYPRAGPLYFAEMEYAADVIYTAPISATDALADTCALAYVYQTPCKLPDGGTFCSLQDGGTCL